MTQKLVCQQRAWQDDRFLSLNQAISCHVIKNNTKTDQSDRVPASGFGRVSLTLWATRLAQVSVDL